MGLYFKCYLYYGITSFSRPYTFVRVTNFTSIGAGSTVELVIQKLLNPATANLIMNYELRITGADIYEYTYIYAAAYTLSGPAVSSTTSGTLSITPVACFSVVDYSYSVTLA